MEVGTVYAKNKLHGQKYFQELIKNDENILETVVEMARLSRSNLETLKGIQKKLIQNLKKHDLIKERVKRLMTIPGVGEITALTWVLETGEPERFRSIKQAIS